MGQIIDIRNPATTMAMAPVVVQTNDSFRVGFTMVYTTTTIAVAPYERGVVFLAADDDDCDFDCRAIIDYAGGGDVRVLEMAVVRASPHGLSRVDPHDFWVFGECVRRALGRSVAMDGVIECLNYLSDNQSFMVRTDFEKQIADIRPIQRLFRRRRCEKRAARAAIARLRFHWNVHMSTSISAFRAFAAWT